MSRDIHIQYGRYQGWLSRKWGYFINIPGIDRWGVEEMTEYIEFLKLLIQERQKWDAQNKLSNGGSK